MQVHIFNITTFSIQSILKIFLKTQWYVNEASDPVEDMLEVYDQIIGDYLKLSKNGNQILQQD